MSVDNACRSFKRKLDSKLEFLDKTKARLRTKKNELDKKIEKVSDKEPIPDLESKIENNSKDISNSIEGLTSEITAYTGSCLDGIVSSLNDIKNNTENLIGSTLDLMDGDWNDLSKGLGEFNSLIKNLGIDKLISGAEKLFGCLADNNDCLPINYLSEVESKLEAIENEFGLNMGGEFDVDYYLSTKDLTSGIRDNIISLNASIKDLAEEAKNLANNTEGVFKVPEEWI